MTSWVDRVGPEPPGPGPVGGHVARLGQLPPGRLGVGVRPTAEAVRRRIVVPGQPEVHGSQRRLADRPAGRVPVQGEWSVSDWNYADVWEIVADVLPDAPALVQGDRTLDLGRGRPAGRRGRPLAARPGVAHQDKVALYLYNCPEYLEATFAAFKVGLVPVNTNYRYADDELALPVAQRRRRGRGLPRGLRRADRGGPRPAPRRAGWLWVDDGTAPCPRWAVPYEERRPPSTHRAAGPGALGTQRGRPLHALHRGHHRHAQGRHVAPGRPVRPPERRRFRRYGEDGDIDGVRAELGERCRDDPAAGLPPDARDGRVHRPRVPGRGRSGGDPHGPALRPGGAARHRRARGVNGLIIVGDAFAQPILAALDAHPGRWDLSSLVGIISSGVMWSEETKGACSATTPTCSWSTPSRRPRPSGWAVGLLGRLGGLHGAVHPGPRGAGARHRGPERRAGSDRVGVLALGGRNPLGYYKDADKSAATFRTIDGVRYSVPGDYAQVRADGTIHLLGRGSVCINTGGEKVFPEEVEETLKTHTGCATPWWWASPTNASASRSSPWSSRPRGGGDPASRSDTDRPREGQPGPLQGAPPGPVVPSIGRSPNGKVDYARHRGEAADWVAAVRLSPGRPVARPARTCST